MKPLENDVLTKIYEKLLSYLTHQWVILDSFNDMSTSWSMSTRDSVMDTESREHWSEMKPSHAMCLYSFICQLQGITEEKLSSSLTNGKAEDSK